MAIKICSFLLYNVYSLILYNETVFNNIFFLFLSLHQKIGIIDHFSIYVYVVCTIEKPGYDYLKKKKLNFI